ncbi:hypothetical protein EH331_14390 [Enterococcus faecalis]|nr:hypothetical protein [Enterococcus faecalis]
MGSNYILGKNNSIKNILMAKEGKYYQDKEGKVIKGHIEKYGVVDEVFKHLTDNKPIEQLMYYTLFGIRIKR